MAVILRDDAATLGITLDRHVIGHRVSADDGCARMHALAAHVALDGLRRVYDRLDILFGVVGLLQIGVGVQRLLDSDTQLVADHLADLVAYAVGIVEHARRVAHGVFRLQLAERDNARNVIGAVHLANVLDDLLTTFILEVAVDIGHLNAFRGKESLEQQAVGKRLQVGDTHGICNDRTGSRTTAWSNTDALASRPVQVFLHNQEVRREALLDDDAHLIFGTIERLFGNGIAVALLHAFEHLMAEPALVRLALGKRELRQNGIALKDDVALLGNLHRGIACLGEIAKRLAHLLFGFHIELVVLELHAIRIVNGGARADAQHDILRLRVFLQQVVEVVRCDGLQARTVSNLGKLVIQLGLRKPTVGADALVLQFDIEIARFETARELVCPLHRLIELTVIQQFRNDARDARRRADNALAILLQHAECGTRLVVEVVNMRFADQVQQVVIAFVGFGEQQQVVKLGLHILAKFLVGGEIHFAAVNRLDLLAGFLLNGGTSIAQLGDARHNAMIANGDSRHVELGRAAYHILDMGEAVKQRVFGMVVQMNERHGCASNLLASDVLRFGQAGRRLTEAGFSGSS